MQQARGNRGTGAQHVPAHLCHVDKARRLCREDELLDHFVHGRLPHGAVHLVGLALQDPHLQQVPGYREAT